MKIQSANASAWLGILPVVLWGILVTGQAQAGDAPGKPTGKEVPHATEPARPVEKLDEPVASPELQEANQKLRQAAEHGNAEAQFELGMRYAEGKGMPKDLVQAHMWMNLAASQGKESAIRMHDELARRMTPAQNAQADELSNKWKASHP
ncbi:MAG: sel1 repeat family protein [Magnetococcus sp. DMHC-8]